MAIREAPYSILCPCDECLYPCEGYVVSCKAWKEWAMTTQGEWRQRKWAELAVALRFYQIPMDCPC